MKRVLLLLIISIVLLSFSKPPKTYYSQVYNVNGVEAYILSEPVRPYEIVIGNDKSLNFTSLLIGGIIKQYLNKSR